jgi:mannosyltransferase OCH1-like enzyme
MKDVPRVIWSYWHDEQHPQLIDLCLKSWKTNLPDYSIKLLNAKNIYNYIDVSDENKIKLSKLGLAKQSDYFRFCLLYKYGGIWVDASTFINKNLEFIHDLFKKDSELDVFFSIKNLKYNDNEFCMWETFFIASPKNTEFIKLLKEKFEDVYFYNGTYLKPSIIDIIKTGFKKDYHAVYWFYYELAKNNDYFRSQCCKQSFFSDNIMNYEIKKSYNIMKNHINYYKRNLPSNDVKTYSLYKIINDVRNFKPTFLNNCKLKLNDFYVSQFQKK